MCLTLTSIFAGDCVGQNELPMLTIDNAQQWRVNIEPDAEETRYLQISWRESLLRGMREAKQSDKPVMLFVMNGHPLGCT
jgi:hypothetical protein